MTSQGSKTGFIASLLSCCCKTRKEKKKETVFFDIYVNPTQQTCIQFESAELFNAGEVLLLHDRATLKARLSTWAWPM
jgi:hypothetical protein